MSLDPSLLAETQLALAQVIKRRKGIDVRIYPPAATNDEHGLTEVVLDLVDKAGLAGEYAHWLKESWESKPGVAMVNASLEDRCRAALVAVTNMNPVKHVIFLGAGASHSAGYPLGYKLAELMKNPSGLKDGIQKALKNARIAPQKAETTYEEVISPFYRRFEEPLRIFKDSGYKTIDHFSKEARNGKYAQAAQELKKLVRLILAIPSAHDFEVSDYADFVEKLFITGAPRVREDIAILTFNYDPCLQYHLCGRLRSRNQLNPAYSPSEQISQQRSIFSGIGGWPETSWSKGTFMPILQLHGAILYPEQVTLGNQVLYGKLLPSDLFESACLDVIATLCDPTLEAPPLAFPFELFDDNGSFGKEAEFPISRPGLDGPENLHSMFWFLWEHARMQIQMADKVSFVGLSLHSFLEPGLRFLFRNKIGPTQVVIANPEVQKHSADDPMSIGSRTLGFLREATNGRMTCIRSARDATVIKGSGIKTRTGVSTWPNFADFIANEL